MKRMHLGIAAVALACCAVAARATPTYFFGEDPSAGGVVDPAKAPATERAAFLSSLAGGVTSIGFESFALGTTAPLALGFAGSGGTIGATLSTAAGLVTDASSQPITKRFNTTAGGANWWDGRGDFELSFADPIAALGFYATDVGDFGSSLQLALTDTTGAVTNVTVPNSLGGDNASLLFWGFLDKDVSYTKIAFSGFFDNASGSLDAMGFDDFVAADAGQLGGGTPPGTVPEPGSLALVAGSLGALAWSVRRRHSRPATGDV